MKIAVIITGILRNYHFSTANWQWPSAWEVDYFLVTWDAVLTRILMKDNPHRPPVYSSVEDISNILAIRETRIYPEWIVHQDAFAHHRQMYLWRKALDLAEDYKNEYEGFIIIRPDGCVYRTKLADDELYTQMFSPRTIVAEGSFVDELGPEYENATDYLVLFHHTSLDAMKSAVNNLLDLNKENISRIWNIHLHLCLKLKDARREHGIEIVSLSGFDRFTTRRQGPLKKADYDELTLEWNYSRWYRIRNIMGHDYCGLLAPLPEDW